MLKIRPFLEFLVQYGTAVITLAALINSLKLLSKKIVSGAGSVGYGEKAGCKDIVVTDSKGATYEGRKDLNDKDRDGYNSDNNTSKQEISRKVIQGNREGV